MSSAEVSVNVEEVEEIVTNKINRISVFNTHVTLSEKTLSTQVNLYDGDKYIKSEVVALTPQEYDLWLTDEYLFDLVLQKLSLRRQTA